MSMLSDELVYDKFQIILLYYTQFMVSIWQYVYDSFSPLFLRHQMESSAKFEEFDFVGGFDLNTSSSSADI